MSGLDLSGTGKFGVDFFLLPSIHSINLCEWKFID
jgi:hypothetical protein